MKNIISILILSVLLYSCSELDINSDPDNLAEDEVTPSVQLPAGIAGIAGSQGAYGALIGGFWSQYWTQSNASNQYKTIDDYGLTIVDYNGLWTSMYDALGDIRNVKEMALEEQNWNYYLIATVLEVQGSQFLADFYDQIPYDEANKPLEFPEPHFQSGEELYDVFIAELDDALSRDLENSIGESPADDDFLFQGDMSQWIRYANTLKLKIYMRQTEARPSIAQEGITELLTSGAEFLTVDAAMTQFIDEANRSNPLYESDKRQLNTTLNLRASKTMYSFLEENNDPRIDLFYTEGDPLIQGDYNSDAASADIAVVVLDPEASVYFLSKAESFFLQAEADLRYNGGANTKNLYDQAVTAGMAQYEIDAAPFIAAGGAYEYPASGTFDEQLKAIITHKWLSGFPGNGYEAFFETNRTGYPEVSDVPQDDASYVPGELSYSLNGTTGGEFPKRMLFPSAETSYNSNAPEVVPITEPVWWDQ